MGKRERTEAIKPTGKGKRAEQAEAAAEMEAAEAAEESGQGVEANGRRPEKKSILSEAAFCGFLLVLLILSFLFRAKADGIPRQIFGYSAQVVVSGSMQDTYSVGSLIVAKRTDPELLRVGDDITFLSGQSATITHRIVGILEGTGEDGERTFETQGTMNEKPDKNAVPAKNVIGKVVFSSLLLGKIALFINKRYALLIGGMVAFNILLFTYQHIKGDPPAEGETFCPPEEVLSDPECGAAESEELPGTVSASAEDGAEHGEEQM